MAKERAEVLHRIGIAAYDRQIMIVRVLKGELRALQQWSNGTFTVHALELRNDGVQRRETIGSSKDYKNEYLLD